MQSAEAIACHARESRHPQGFDQTLDCRLRWNDMMIECDSYLRERRETALIRLQDQSRKSPGFNETADDRP